MTPDDLENTVKKLVFFVGYFYLLILFLYFVGVCISTVMRKLINLFYSEHTVITVPITACGRYRWLKSKPQHCTVRTCRIPPEKNSLLAFGFDPHTFACTLIHSEGWISMRTMVVWGRIFSQWPLINNAIVQVTEKSNEADWWLIGTLNINETRMSNAQYGGRVH